MSRNFLDLRIAVVALQPLASSLVWRIWSNRKGDVFFASRGLAHVTKVSFHKSGICRDAFTSEHGRPVTMPDRAMARWERPAIPQSSSGEFARLLLLGIPTDYLSPRTSIESKVVQIPAAPPGDAAFVELGLFKGDHATVDRAMQDSSIRQGILGVAQAWEDVFVFARWYHGAWDNHDLNLPASPELGSHASLRFWASDAGIDRPIRLTFHAQVKDHEALVLTELGGRLLPGQEHLNWVAQGPPVVPVEI